MKNPEEKTKFSKSAFYEIQIEGLLHDSILDRFIDMKIVVEKGKDHLQITTISGKFPDQATLSGVLNYLYELHLTVLSVIRHESEEENTAS